MKTKVPVIHEICVVSCHAVLCCALLCCAVLCCVVLCCVVLCCAALCCAALRCIVPYVVLIRFDSGTLIGDVNLVVLWHEVMVQSCVGVFNIVDCSVFSHFRPAPLDLLDHQVFSTFDKGKVSSYLQKISISLNLTYY